MEVIKIVAQASQASISVKEIDPVGFVLELLIDSEMCELENVEPILLWAQMG